MAKTLQLLTLFTVMALSVSPLVAQEVGQAAKREALHKALVAPLDNAPQRALVGLVVDGGIR